MDTKKQKVIKVLKRIGIALSIGFNVLFLIAIIVGSSGIKNKSNNVQVACAESEVIKVDSQVNKKLVSYDDSRKSLTLSVDELNTYTFTNLSSYINANGTNNTIYGTFGYGNDEADFKVVKNATSCWLYSDINDDDAIMFICFDSQNQDYIPYFNKWLYSGLNGFDEFNVSLTLTFMYAEDYRAYKNAIELDIQANSSNINDGIFETLTSGVVAFIGSLSSGITAMTSVFYDSANSQLTTIGLLSVIVVAVSFSCFLFRLIIGLIRMRG